MNTDDLMKALTDFKAGWKTTEFYQGVFLLLVWAMHVVRPNVGWLTIVETNQSTLALLAMSIVFAVYTAGRCALKIAHMFGLLKVLTLPGDDIVSAPAEPVTFPVAPSGVGAGVVLPVNTAPSTGTLTAPDMANWQVTNSTVANPATTTTTTLSAS